MLTDSTNVRAWLIWGVASLFVVYNYMQQVVPGVIATDLARDFHVNAAALGGLAAWFFYAYALLQIPVGLAVDRFGPRWPLTLAIAIATVGGFGFSVAGSAGWAGFARLVIGAGAAFSFIACLKLVVHWFAPDRFATLAGMTNTAGMIGAAAGAPLAVLANHTGWHGATLLLAALGVVILVLALLFVRDNTAMNRQRGEVSGLGAALREVLCSRVTWLNALYATAISISFVAFGALWGPPYIAKTYEVDTPAANGVVAMLFLGAIAGSLFFGWCSDVVRSRRLPMIAAAMGGLFTLAAILYLPELPLGLLRLLLALLGFFCSANIISYAVATDIRASSCAGLALGFLNSCYYAGSALSQPLIGWLLDRRCPAGLAALQPADYRFAFTSVLVLLAVAFAAVLLLPETHPNKR